MIAVELYIHIYRANYSLFDFYFDFPGKLTLKIPWKNLYNDAVVVTLDGLYLLVVPRAGKSCSKGSNLNKCVASRGNVVIRRTFSLNLCSKKI